MDWKELQKRLDEYNNTPLVQKKGQYEKPSKVMTPEKMKHFWDLCHKDLSSSFRKLLVEAGFKDDSIYTVVKRWFISRGWGELPERINNTELYCDKIYELHQQGLSSIKISEQVPLCTDTIREVLKEKFNVDFGLLKPPTEEEINEFNRLTDEGYSVRKIGKMTGRSVQTVRKYRKKTVTPKEKHVSKQNLYKEQVIRLYEDGKSQMDIVRVTGVSKGTIGRIIEKYIKTKSQNENRNTERS